MNSLFGEAEQLRLALEAARMGIWDWNILTNEITWSSGHEQLFGLEIGSFDGTYATFIACIHPDDRASVAEMLNSACQERRDYQQEFRVVWSDSSIHWIEGKGRFFYDDGQAVRMMGTVLDISDRKRMELALQDSENRLRAIIAAEPECVKLVAADGTLLNMNAAGLEMIEVQSAQEAIGQSVYPLIAPEYKTAFQELNESVCKSGNSGKLEFEIVGRKGKRRWLETHAVPLHNEADKTIVQLAVTRDITDRKQVEKNLRSRVHQQAAVAKLGQLALADTDLSTLMDEAVFLIAQCLEVEYCKVLELLPDGQAMLLRAGVGWQAGLVGQATVSSDINSQAGYTLHAQGPVIVEDLRQEQRFSGPPLLHQHQVISGLSTIIAGKNKPYGVLGAHTTKQRQFDQDDIYFLQAVANVLAEAIARQSAEQILRSSLQELANIKFALDASSIVAITDRRGIITYANDKFCEISQYSRTELVGQNHRIINSHYHPPDFFTQMWATISQGQVWQGEIKNRAKDKSFYWVDTTIVPLLDAQEKPYQYIAIRTDITARKRAEAQLLTAKDELEIRVAKRTAELIKVNEQLQLELDERKRAESALERLSRQNQLILNSVGEGLCGLDMQGKITFVNPAAATMLGYSIAELGGKSIYTILAAVKTDETLAWSKSPIYESLRNGAVHQVTNEVFWRKDNSSFPVEYVSTPIREAEEIVGVITFKDITDRQQIERMKDEFISVVSHELRTPLTSIHGSLGMLKSGLIDANSERGKRLLEIATDSSDRLVRLINDILDIERIESGKVQMVKQVCNAADLINEAANIIQPIALKFGVNLVVASIDVELRADSDRIIQTLTNLLSNAIKFSPPASTVELTAEIHSQQVLFQVKDSGRGIPADKLETIFERFQQVDVSDSRDREGTGLGLAICRSIVQQHNGEIWVESTLTEGSIFSFTLPIPQQAQIAPDPQLTRPLVLVCDDDSRTRHTLQNMLQQQNYGVVTVGSGQEAVEQAVRQQPDAIVLDLVMPGVNGWEVMASLKQHTATRNIPIVVCSVCSPEERHQEEFANWVVKPLDEALLLRSIEQVLVQSDRTNVRILLVEDDPDLAKLLITVFEERGVEIFLAKTGREAIQLSWQINPDLLILDLVLPDGNGFDVALWSQHNYLHRLPLVVYSARELDNFERDRLKLGQTEFLTKGRVSTQELEQRVMKLLQSITQEKMQDNGNGKTSFGS